MPKWTWKTRWLHSFDVGLAAKVLCHRRIGVHNLDALLKKGFTEIVRLLLEAGANKGLDENSRADLMSACYDRLNRRP